MVDPAAGLVLIAAAGYGLALILVKQLTREVSPGAIVVWMILIQLPLGFLVSLTDWRPVSFTDVPWMLSAGIGALAAHYCQAQTLKRLGASAVIPIDFMRVPMAAVVGYYAHGEAIDPWSSLAAASSCFPITAQSCQSVVHCQGEKQSLAALGAKIAHSPSRQATNLPRFNLPDPVQNGLCQLRRIRRRREI
ncbi:putative membrane protein [Pseudorhizobium tarimense]|uniref:Membrane protein n=1 Tax=Pseudorhizobium tarimense TaxID=1079109 RepID=A0ABV2H5S9_9HYPH|nr:DMT family transporter [Pseudorhizobium tarimense]MCJ8519253.1 DMT family transporter [Pseudorhizobium tarimense]